MFDIKLKILSLVPKKIAVAHKVSSVKNIFQNNLQIYLISLLHQVSFHHYSKQQGQYPLTKRIQSQIVSVFSNIEKILEKLLCKRVYQFLTKNNIIYDLEFGFRKNFSTAPALINLSENIRHALDEGYIGCGIFVDLQEAFDTVEHEILLAKLNLKVLVVFQMTGLYLSF